MESGNRGAGLGAQQKGNPFPPPLGVIVVIHAVPRGTNIARMRVSVVASTGNFLENQPPAKKMKSQLEPITFDDEDLEGTIQLHEDALVITARIGGFLVKKVMVDQASGADVMYPDLLKGLELKDQDLTKYDSPLVSFEGSVVIPQGQISLPISTEGKEVMVTFIVVNSLFLVHGNSGKALNSRNGGHSIHFAYEGQISNRTRRCYCEGKPESGLAMPCCCSPLER